MKHILPPDTSLPKQEAVAPSGELARFSISLDAWYPIVSKLVSTPKTIIVRAAADLAKIAYGDEVDEVVEAAFRDVVIRVRDAGNALGWPVFLRSGYGSAKHDWQNTCFLARPSDVEAHLNAIIEWSEVVDILGLPSDVWAVREMLDVPFAFRAFRGSMPISRERRYFVVDGHVVGHHPYWPPEAFLKEQDDIFYDGESEPQTFVQESIDGIPDNWRGLLDQMNTETPGEVAELTALCELVGRAISGAWSVDWLWAGSRDEPAPRWYLTDMAWAERSFVWWDHPSAPPRTAFGGSPDEG